MADQDRHPGARTAVRATIASSGRLSTSPSISCTSWPSSINGPPIASNPSGGSISPRHPRADRLMRRIDDQNAHVLTPDAARDEAFARNRELAATLARWRRCDERQTNAGRAGVTGAERRSRAGGEAAARQRSGTIAASWRHRAPHGQRDLSRPPAKCRCAAMTSGTGKSGDFRHDPPSEPCFSQSLCGYVRLCAGPARDPGMS